MIFVSISCCYCCYRNRAGPPDFLLINKCILRIATSVYMDTLFMSWSRSVRVKEMMHARGINLRYMGLVIAEVMSMFRQTLMFVLYVGVKLCMCSSFACSCCCSSNFYSQTSSWTALTIPFLPFFVQCFTATVRK